MSIAGVDAEEHGVDREGMRAVVGGHGVGETEGVVLGHDKVNAVGSAVSASFLMRSPLRRLSSASLLSCFS